MFTGSSAIAGAPSSGPSTAIPVEVVQRDGGWILLRGGQPYFIKGAGGTASLADLAKTGANSVRTWGVDGSTGALLDRAHALGLTVTVGIWLGHTRHGFDYGDAAQVAAQLATARAAVERYKDHPALLMWGVGNEMEGFEAKTDPAVWRAVDAVAAMIQAVDPHHPTMTVTAELGGDRVNAVSRRCPAIDIHGINSYGGAVSLPQRYRELNGTKPYILTEFGPPGTWETGKTPWGAAPELTSAQKAVAYAETWQHAIRGSGGWALGGYAFTWGAKTEATATWFGLRLPDGNALSGVDALTEIWTGAPPPNRAPELSDIRLDGPAVLKPGARVTARVDGYDPDGDSLQVTWALHLEVVETVGGDGAPPAPSFLAALTEATTEQVTLTMPEGGGGYRLYATARDGRGRAATASLPLFVDGPKRPPPAARPALPFVLYADDVGTPPYAPSGWMGATDMLTVDNADTTRPARGATSMRIDYKQGGPWVGVVWQSPAHDWGERPGGWDLTGARTLSFWARGAKGDERVTFLAGLIKDDKPFPDTARVELKATLGRRWQRYVIRLDGEDLSRMKTGFGFIISENVTPVTFWVDDVRYD